MTCISGNEISVLDSTRFLWRNTVLNFLSLNGSRLSGQRKTTYYIR